MGFEARTLYSGKQPIISAAFLTAGSYEYILAIPSYLLHIQYIIIYYRAAAVFNSLFVVLSIYLLLSRFSEDTASALLGTFVVLCLLVVMSENSWAIGGLSFIHVYEGKSILLIDSIPLMVVYSLDYLNHMTMRTWLQLLGLCNRHDRNEHIFIDDPAHIWNDHFSFSHFYIQKEL